MASITGTPFLIKDALLTLGTDDYSLVVSQAELVPTTPTATFKAINGTSYNFSGKASWVLTAAFAQDWDNAASLSNYLFDNEGDTVAFSLKPNGATGESFTGNLVLSVGNIGGTADGVAASSVTFQVIGKPVRA